MNLIYDDTRGGNHVLNWLQTVEYDGHLKVDSDDISGLYNTGPWVSKMTNPGGKGWDVGFVDTPAKYFWSGPHSWTAELSLVEINNGNYNRLATFSYGFSIADGRLVASPFVQIRSPSEFHTAVIGARHYP